MYNYVILLHYKHNTFQLFFSRMTMKKEFAPEFIEDLKKDADRFYPLSQEFLSDKTARNLRLEREKYLFYRMKGWSHMRAHGYVQFITFFKSELVKSLVLYVGASTVVLAAAILPDKFKKQTTPKNVVPPQVLKLWEQKNHERKTGTRVISSAELETYENKHSITENDKGTKTYSAKWLQDYDDEVQWAQKRSGKVPRVIFVNQEREEIKRALRHPMMQMTRD